MESELKEDGWGEGMVGWKRLEVELLGMGIGWVIV